MLTVDVPDTLDEGTYVVSWRVVSADGHPVAGALTFSVGRPSAVVRPPPTPDESSASGVRGALSAVQAIGYLGLFLAAGLVVFAGWLLPALPRLDVLRRRLRRVARGAASVAALAGLVQLPLSGAYQQGLGFAGLLEASAWSGAGGRDLLALAMLVGGLAMAVGPLGADPWVGVPATSQRRERWWRSRRPSVVGHSRAYAPQFLVVATDVLHVAVGAVWLGGLAGLALSLPALAGRSRAAAETLARFSGLAAGLLTLLVASGSLLAWRIIGSWDDLFGTTYGRLLIVKVMIAALAVAIAAWNRFALLPRIVAAADRPERLDATSEIRRAVLAEASVLVAVLLVTGFLVNQPPRQAPPVVAPAGTGVVTGDLGEDLRVLAPCRPAPWGRTPSRSSSRTSPASRSSRPGHPLCGCGRATSTWATWRSRQRRRHLSRRGRAPTAGTWRVQVSLRIDEFENPVASLSFRVPRGGR